MGGLAEGADLGGPLPGSDLFGEELRTVPLDLLLASQWDGCVPPTAPLGFEKCLLLVPTFGFRSEAFGSLHEEPQA
ncbi:hypothetical protein AB0M29_10730 [Streptomyces sp. NPDC051976]|uniref:hypothetical protein n=1 Tax=Streptomyces sp. NPDC051976 TaxID=3154947 RepID=UPI0034459A68